MLGRFEFEAYDINGSDSWVPYYMAGEGYLEGIEKFLTKYPHLIDQIWSGNGEAALQKRKVVYNLPYRHHIMDYPDAFHTTYCI